MIELKKKPCKGRGMAKGHGCGKPTYHRKYGLGKGCCYIDWLLNTDAGKLKLNNSILKASKPRLDFERAKTIRKEHSSLKSLLTNVTIQLHRYIRKRDEHKPCISCNVEWNDTFQAGHFYKAELYSNLKFDKDNIHGQCVRCNNFLEGNEGGYRVGLINRYGKEFVDALDKIAQSYKKQDFKWNIEELKKIKTEIQTLKKQL